MFRAIVLSLILLIIGIGLPIGLASMNSSKRNASVGAKKSKKHAKRYSRRWWRNYRAKLRRQRALAAQRKRYALLTVKKRERAIVQLTAQTKPVISAAAVPADNFNGGYTLAPKQDQAVAAIAVKPNLMTKSEAVPAVSLNSSSNSNVSNYSDEPSVVSKSAANESTAPADADESASLNNSELDTSKIIKTRLSKDVSSPKSISKAAGATIPVRDDGNSVEPRTLSLREVIEMTLANNKDIELGRQSVRLAEYDLQESSAVTIPKFTSFTGGERNVEPAFNLLNSGVNGKIAQSSFTTQSGVEGKFLKYGSTYNVDFSSSRRITNDQFVPFSPNYASALSFGVTQPLMRNRKFDKDRRAIEIGKKNLQLADAQFRRNVIELVTSAETAYWDLAYALRSLQIQNEMLRDARAQLEHTQRLVEKGKLAPVDAASAELQVANFERSVYSSNETVSRAENALKNLITENSQSALWSTSLITTDVVDAQAPNVTLPEALQAATKNRAELQQSEILASVNEIDRQYFRNQLKPQIDLVANYTLGGYAGNLVNDRLTDPLGALAGPLQNRINVLSQLNGLPALAPLQLGNRFPQSFIGGYDNALGNLFANRFVGFRFGVTVSLPFKNRAAEAQLGRSLVEGERIKTQRERTEQTIQVEVRNAYQAVRAAQLRLTAAIAARRAAEEQYTSVQRKFASGYSTVFQVMERQTVLANSRDQEVRAKIELRKATAEFQRATGDSLTLNSILVASKN